MTCIICWEEENDLAIAIDQQQQQVMLQPCRHTACQQCIKDWIETCETNSRDEATCPHCRQVLCQKQVCREILDRPYRPANRQTPAADDDWVDDFTMTWLQENGARTCPNCGAWMINEEESSEPEMCLCGFCYCWDCDDCALDCECNHHDVYDSLTDRNVTIDRDNLLVATEEDRWDFRAFLQRRLEAEQPSETFVEEPAEADFVSIFDYEESAEADFVPITEWYEEEIISMIQEERTRMSEIPCSLQSQEGNAYHPRPRSLIRRAMSC